MSKPCGCKGIRSCLLCEKSGFSKGQCGIQSTESMIAIVYEYCPYCGLCWPRESAHILEGADVPPPFFLEGIRVVSDFVSETEERDIVDSIDQVQWMPSQSGRRKQDFGPKVNFKKQKVKCETFGGFPDFADVVTERMSNVEALADFRPVELCNLEYCAERGSAIDPHVDDCWLWGERLVTLNLLSSTVLTLSPTSTTESDSCCCTNAWRKPPSSDDDVPWTKDVEQTTSCGHSYPSKPNLSDAVDDTTPLSVLLGGSRTGETLPDRTTVDATNHRNVFKPEVRITLPPRSVLVLSACARYHWFHEIKREDVSSRRLAMTFRELSSDFLEGGMHWETGKKLLELSKVKCRVVASAS